MKVNQFSVARYIQLKNLAQTTTNFTFGAIPFISKCGDCTRWCNYPSSQYADTTVLLGTTSRGMKWKINLRGGANAWIDKEGWLKVRAVIFSDSRFVGSNYSHMISDIIYNYVFAASLFVFFILFQYSPWVGKVILMWRLRCILQSVLRMYVPMNHPTSGDALFSKVDSSQPVQATVWLGSSCDDKVTKTSNLANYKW